MYIKALLPWNVVVTPKELDAKGLLLQRAIIVQLMEEFANKRATKEYGYHIAVTNLMKIGDAKVREKGDVLFPVNFKCITFKPFAGEVLVGVVTKVMKHCVVMDCGPIENVYLACTQMLDYEYVHGENPVFMNKELSKMEKDAKVRFKVIGTRWIESERIFKVLGSLAGDYLGPISVS